MNKILFKITACAIGLLFANSYGQNLENHRWKNRVLIVKTSHTNSKKYVTQLKEFQNFNDELKERKLIIYNINNDEYSSINYSTNTHNTGIVSKEVHSNILTESKNFEVILIGLDGNIKLQKNETIAAERLFSIIDAMQMRKYELKN